MKKSPKEIVASALAVHLTILMMGFASSRSDSRGGASEKVAIIPFEVKGLSKEEGLLLTERFMAALAETKRYQILTQKEVSAILQEADFKNLEECNYSLCLADLGKVLGVPKVIHGSVGKRGKAYSVRIRLIDVEKADVLYERKSDYSGDFEFLALDHIPKQARDLADTEIESSGKWYVIAAVVLVTLGTIYSVYKVFTKNSGGDESGGGSPPTPQ